MKIVFILVLIVIGFIPTFIAFRRDHDSKVAILVLNILFGATGIAWIILLVWAFSEDNRVSDKGYVRKADFDLLPKKECSNCKNMINYDYSSCPKCGFRFGVESTTKSEKDIKIISWCCKKCGALNSLSTITCVECGTYK